MNRARALLVLFLAALLGAPTTILNTDPQLIIPVRVVETGTVTPAGGAPDPVDGVSLAVNDRVLYAPAGGATAAGIYRVTTVGTGANGTWVRADDSDESLEFIAGRIVPVSEGTANADSIWQLTTNDPITLGATSVTFAKFAGGGGAPAYTDITSVPTDRLLGRDTAGTGAAEAIPVDTTLEFTGGPGLRRAALTGDVTAAAGSNATAIADDVVTNADLRNSGALSVIGRSANSAGDPGDISAAAASGAVLRESGSVLGFGTIATAGIADDAVTYAKLQNVSATDRCLGRVTGGAGNAEEFTCTSYARTLLDDADAAAARATLGAASTAHNDTHATGGSDAFSSADILDATVRNIRETSGPTTLAMGAVADGQMLTRSGASIAGQDPLTHTDIFRAAQMKAPVRVATTANVTVGGGAPNTLDGISLAAGDRVLVKNQSTASQNGIYYVSTLGTGSNGTWTRTSDFDSSTTGVASNGTYSEVMSGSAVRVSQGTANGAKAFYVSTTGAITVGSTAIAWTQIPEGDVVGPASSTDNAVARFDSTTGKLLQNSTATLSDTGTFVTSANVAGVFTGLSATNSNTGISAIVYGAEATNNLGSDLRLQLTGGGYSSATWDADQAALVTDTDLALAWIGNLKFYQSGTNFATLASNGNFATSGTGPVDITANATSTAQYSRFVMEENGVDRAMIEYVNSTFGTANRQTDMDIINNVGELTFWTAGTHKMQLTTGGVLAIGMPNVTPVASMLALGAGLSNTKLSLWDNGTTAHGIGIQSGQMRFHVGAANEKFSWFTSAAGTEVMTLLTPSSLGRLGVQATSPGVSIVAGGGFAMVPAADTLTSNSDTIAQQDSSFWRVTANGVYTDIRMPDGMHSGHYVVVMNVGANTFTIPDNAATNNVNLAAGVALGTGDTLTLIWNAADTTWYQVATSNN